MIREFVEISGFGSIETIIAQLEAVRRGMPLGSSESEVRLRGDDVFGRHILVTYSRPETEAELESARRAQEFARAWSSAPLARRAA